MVGFPSTHRSKEELGNEIPFLKKRIEDLSGELDALRVG